MRSTITILLIEDDKNLGALLKEFLEVKGFSITTAFNGEDALKILHKEIFSLLIIDVMMPKMDGFTLVKKIAEQEIQTPFLFLTAKAIVSDKIHGLKLGADDYITKPFSMEELILRINAILRRSSTSVDKDETQFRLGNFVFDFQERTLQINDLIQKLTSKEAELLQLLCINKNNILERTVALNKIWKNDTYFNSRSMDVYITKLRGFLKRDPSIEIVNIHGTGYKLLIKK
jgi:DNA-binding response OmpR family regulator